MLRMRTVYTTPTGRRLGNVARGIALVWALFWTLFGLLSGIGEGLDLLGILIHTTVPGLIFLAVSAIAWPRPRLAGWLLMVVSIVVALVYTVTVSDAMAVGTILFVLATMALPPLVAGSLLVGIERD